jgi:Zn-finger protein
MSIEMRLCPCGSGHVGGWQYDARGIPLCKTCTQCHERKMARYRKDVLTDPNYWADEPIDEE